MGKGAFRTVVFSLVPVKETLSCLLFYPLPIHVVEKFCNEDFDLLVRSIA